MEMKTTVVNRANARLVKSGSFKPKGDLVNRYTGNGVVKVTYKLNGVTYEKVLTKDKLNSAFEKAKASYAEKL